MRTIILTACALVALSSLARAQALPAELVCRATETQAECHARLKCKADEELDQCQKRLAAAKQQGGARDDGARTNNNNDRGNDRDRANERERERDADRRERNANDGGERRERERDRGGDRDDGPRSRRQRGSGMRGFEANKTFGLGLELGEPTGLNGKLFVSRSGAFDFGLGWIYDHYYYGDGLHLYGDYLWHPTSLVSTPAFELPFYIGVGLRLWDFHYCVAKVCDYGGRAVGIRVPIGISFDMNRTPLDIFIQLVPVLDFLGGDYYDRYRDRAHFGIDFSVGIRFWFK